MPKKGPPKAGSNEAKLLKLQKEAAKAAEKLEKENQKIQKKEEQEKKKNIKEAWKSDRQESKVFVYYLVFFNMYNLLYFILISNVQASHQLDLPEDTYELEKQYPDFRAYYTAQIEHRKKNLFKSLEELGDRVQKGK